MINLDIKPKDIVATVAVITLVMLKVYQAHYDLDSLVALVLGVYFGNRQSSSN